MLTRRAALQGLGASTLAPLIPGCKPGEERLEGTPIELVRARIKHVVVVMMENRSFDHTLGALTLEGRTDVDGLVPGMSNPHPDGHDVEIHPMVGELCVADPPHSWSAGRQQFADGANDGFVAAMHQREPDAADEVMGYLDRDRLSTSYALADVSVVCDRWFCSQLSSTWPNRFYAVAAHNAGHHGNTRPAEPLTTIFERLDDAGIGWGCYFGNISFFVVTAQLQARPELQPIEQFYDDADAGTLPFFTWIDPPFGYADDHPPAHPVSGQIFLASVYDALARSPAWNETLLVITYDEHGGFYDHVPPPLAADALEDHRQLGIRVPTLVIGPWVRAGEAVHTVYDHTSILALIEAMTGVEPLTERDAAADPMLDCFDVETLATGAALAPITLPVIDADPEELQAPQCFYGLLRSADGGVTGQPELEAYANEHLVGSPLDRRDQSEQIWQRILSRAVARGLVR